MPYLLKSEWLKGLLEQGLKVELNILDCDIPDEECSWAERDAIAMCRAIRGSACLNMRAR